uniref:Uncharacterized protein n=1 Tax=Rhizophora mucronata TaxID=61149 RepID=A0A2P2QP25_RHIMU
MSRITSNIYQSFHIVFPDMKSSRLLPSILNPNTHKFYTPLLYYIRTYTEFKHEQ